MASKIIYSALASLLLVQAAYSQCSCIGNLGNVAGISNIGLGNNLINSGATIISNNNLGYGGIVNSGASVISNNVGLIGTPVYTSSGIFSASSGSPGYNYPSGVLINSENQLNGQVALGGNVPFHGAAYYGGEIPSGGEGVITYTAGPSVSLNGGGCGYSYNQAFNPLAGGAAVISNGLGASVFGNGLGGASILNNGLIGTGIECGCRNYGW